MKKALLTTTALVALNSAAFASSIDTPVNSASSTHHTHSAATIVWTGDANIKYNVPLKATAGQSVDGVVASDVDLDVTMTSPGAYSATISAGIEGGALEKLGPNATVTVTTPMFNVSVGTDDAAGGAASPWRHSGGRPGCVHECGGRCEGDGNRSGPGAGACHCLQLPRPGTGAGTGGLR